MKQILDACCGHGGQWIVFMKEAIIDGH
jgi:hypothetical protein